jgi:hypothetical protein
VRWTLATLSESCVLFLVWGCDVHLDWKFSFNALDGALLGESVYCYVRFPLVVCCIAYNEHDIIIEFYLIDCGER